LFNSRSTGSFTHGILFTPEGAIKENSSSKLPNFMGIGQFKKLGEAVVVVHKWLIDRLFAAKIRLALAMTGASTMSPSTATRAESVTEVRTFLAQAISSGAGDIAVSIGPICRG
jgi:hypothetical protein